MQNSFRAEGRGVTGGVGMVGKAILILGKPLNRGFTSTFRSRGQQYTICGGAEQRSSGDHNHGVVNSRL
jgi:hypothetical protein